ncbi:MAG: hypothetical protein RLZZ501_1108 [Pseudomonadota bacterium]|jgi:AraC-like DNA-binding protein
MRWLSGAETRQRIEAVGIERHADAFAFCEEVVEPFAYDWHAHGSDQLLYALRGSLHLETATARFLLPPQRAIWIPAGMRHRTWLGPVRSASVFFPAGSLGEAGAGVRVVAVAPVMREMILYATRWPPDRPRPDELADAYFRALTLLCREWVAHEMPFRLPRSEHAGLARAMDYTQTYLADATLTEACRAAAMSERSLRRHFRRETGMSWQHYLSQSRMLAALAWLAQPGPALAEVADRLGFASLSSFSKSFREFCGETPAAYRRRVAD